MLTERQSQILRSVIQEYIATAMPVSSEVIARDYGLNVSSATIRNEMIALEREGYLMQPHTSAGRVPSARGYRYYVEVLLEEQSLTGEEQRTIRHQFYQVSRGIDDLINLSATILSRMLSSVAIVTSPCLIEPRFGHVNLLPLREFAILAVLVLRDAGFRQRVISTEQDMAQEDLNAIGCKLTALYDGLTAGEIAAQDTRHMSDFERQVTDVVADLMKTEGDEAAGQAHFDGVSQIMSQPEFLKGERARLFMKLLEERSFVNSVLSQAPEDEELRVIIGSENPESSMHDLSLVLSRYGMPEESSGIVGVVGPMRMPYARALSAVRFLSLTMTELLFELYGYSWNDETDRMRR